MKKVLVVTNKKQNAMMHIVPLQNKAFYEQSNTLSPGQYTFKEMSEDEAVKLIEENSNIDPDFKSEGQLSKVVSEKDAEIQRLREELAAALKSNPEGQELRQSLAELSTAGTSTSEYSNTGINKKKEQTVANPK